MIRRLLACAAVLLGVAALFAGSPYRARHAVAEVSPVDLAEWIRDRKPELRVIDPRPAAEFDEYHLPRAENVSPASAAFKPTETIVLVAGDAQGIDHQVYVLRGGVRGWIDEVMSPTITENASPGSARPISGPASSAVTSAVFRAWSTNRWRKAATPRR